MKGFEVQVDVARPESSYRFLTRFKSLKPGPGVHAFGQYGTVGLGHGCGRNLSALPVRSPAFAPQLLSRKNWWAVKSVYGTPGGENGSAKGGFVREGFQGCGCSSAAASELLRPPSDESFLPCCRAGRRLNFMARPAHRECTEQGINALDNTDSELYNGINTSLLSSRCVCTFTAHRRMAVMRR